MTNKRKQEVLEDRPSKVNRSDRPKRVPVNGYRDILSVQGQEPGWHYCWVNEDKIPRHEAAHYEFVTHDVIIGDRHVNTASQIGGKVSIRVGNQLTGFLMRQLQEYYDEDMKALQDDLDVRDESMRASLNNKQDGRYGSVEITQSKPLENLRR